MKEKIKYTDCLKAKISENVFLMFFNVFREFISEFTKYYAYFYILSTV